MRVLVLFLCSDHHAWRVFSGHPAVLFRAETGSVRRNPSSSNLHIIVRTVCDRTKVRYFASYKCLGPER
jgi:hypothetical protein